MKGKIDGYPQTYDFVACNIDLSIMQDVKLVGRPSFVGPAATNSVSLVSFDSKPYMIYQDVKKATTGFVESWAYEKTLAE